MITKQGVYLLNSLSFLAGKRPYQVFIMAKIPVTKRYYEPIPGETHKAWLAFCTYRDLGWNRSLDKAWREATGKDGRHARHWATWSAKNHWVSRSEAYDNAVIKEARRKVQQERAEEYAGRFGRVLW